MSSQPPYSSVPALPPPAAQPEPGMTEGQRKALIFGVGACVVVVAGLIVAAVWLVGNPTQAASVRDVFIIFMALEFMFIGAALVILIFQLAVLTNMLKHEIKPILESTNETVNTVRGTTLFLSEAMVEPIMQLNSYMAALSKVLETFGALGNFMRKK
jgi:predicted tellurium resistance membrane protein TerC